LLCPPKFDKIGGMSDILNQEFPPNLDSIWDKEFALQLAATQGALSGLNQAVSLLHNPNLLMRPLLGKEAESSSRLEGTQASMDDVYRSELLEDPEKSDDVQEIINYQKAMYRGRDVIRTRPLNQFAIRQIHKTLMSGVRGATKTPGKYRDGDVWIGVKGTGVGEARYVPPEAIHIQFLMDELEKFIKSNAIHPLIACGLIHYRFEAIHPFKDGNGRTGRLLITLFLLKAGMLSKPMLYPSGFFEKQKSSYMDALHAVDTDNNWYAWLMYFLQAIQTQADLSLKVARQIDSLFKNYRNLIQDETAHIALFRMLEYCFTQPYISVPLVNNRLTIPEQTVRRYINTLVEKSVITHVDTSRRGERIYANIGLLDILRQI
jgi:Fic family protein